VTPGPLHYKDQLTQTLPSISTPASTTERPIVPRPNAPIFPPLLTCSPPRSFPLAVLSCQFEGRLFSVFLFRIFFRRWSYASLRLEFNCGHSCQSPSSDSARSRPACYFSVSFRNRAKIVSKVVSFSTRIGPGFGSFWP